MRVLLLFSLSLSLHGANLYRIAAGSSTGGVDAAGHAWQSDAYFSGGTEYSRANMAALGLPYRALRYGTFGYTLPAAAGNYTVTLNFLENRSAASSPAIGAGQRLISVSINGTAVIASLDLFAAVGSLMPYSVAFPVTVSGPISISIAPLPGSLPALLSGIQVDSIDPPPPPSVSAARAPCELPIGFSPGGFFSQVMSFQGCWNTTGALLSPATVRCWTDGTNVNILSVLLPDSSGALLPVAPEFACTPNAPPQVVQLPAGVTYANNTGMTFALRIVPPEVVNGATQVSPGQFVIVVTYGDYVAPVARLESINTCIGSGPGDASQGLLPWDCAGLYWAKVTREDGSILNVIGPDMLPPKNTVSLWDLVK